VQFHVSVQDGVHDPKLGCLGMGGEQMEANFEQVGKAFIQHYYQAFDTNRAALADLYQGESMSVPPPPSPVHPLFLCKYGRKKWQQGQCITAYSSVACAPRNRAIIMCVIRNRATVVSSPENVWLTRAFPPSFPPHRICTSVCCIYPSGCPLKVRRCRARRRSSPN